MNRIKIIILILFLFQISHSQKKIIKKELYEGQILNNIDSLEKAGLPQSAFKLTEELYQKSVLQKNTSLFIKSLVLRMKYREDITEESLAVFINELEMQVINTWEPAKQIMHSLIAEMYQWYFNNNQWRLYNTPDVDSDKNDIREMGAMALSSKSIEHYLLSLINPHLLQNEKLENFKDILGDGSGKFNLRPTLFDFLSVRAAEALLSDALFNEPSNSGQILESSALLGNLNSFVSINFKTRDNSGYISGLSILQEWIKFRLANQLPEPLLDADLTRLRLISEMYRGQDFEELYEKALTGLSEKSRSFPLFSLVMFEKARFLNSVGERINSESIRNYKRDALFIAQKGEKAWPGSEGSGLCRSLIDEIKNPSLSIETEESYPIGERFIFKLDYRNVNKVHLNIFKINKPDIETYYSRFSESEIFKQLKLLKPLITKVTNLPDFGDYKNHCAELEITMPANPGNYLIIATQLPLSSNIDDMELFTMSNFQITNLSVFYRETVDSKFDISVLDRINGEPLKEVEIDVIGYNRYTRDSQLLHKLKTDETGRVRFEYPPNFDNLQIKAINGSDIFKINSVWLHGARDFEGEKLNKRVFIFTDRKIYRPGQTIWFKAIMLETNGEVARVLKNSSVAITLHDVNGQEISSQTLITNNFGSVNGNFTIPNNVLTGNFYIQTPHGSNYINVENYKRPRFDVTMNPFNHVVILGDEVKVSGLAEDFSGAPLQKALVSWKITRQISNWRYHRFIKHEPIASGNTITGDRGNFEIQFTAIPSKTKWNNQIPENFIVDVDVTDVNGETRTGSIVLSIGNEGVKPEITMDKNSFLTPVNEVPITFLVKNLTGEPVNAKVNYRISKLVVPTTKTPYRLWQQPDTILINKSFFTNSNEREHWEEWPSANVVLNEIINVPGKLEHKIKFDHNLPAGVYKITMETPDKNNQIRKTERVIYINGLNNLDFNPGEGLLLTVAKNEVFTGDNIELCLASAFTKGSILLLVSQNDKTIIDSCIPVGKIKNRIFIPVTSELEGTVFITAFLVQQNRVYKSSLNIKVFNPANKMNLQLVAFRDKIKPGSNEKWTLKVEDGKKTGYKAELLALMYDSSLDYFVPNHFGFYPFYSSIIINPWRENGFGTGINTGRNNIPVKNALITPYPFFNWFGYYNGRSISRLKMSNGPSPMAPAMVNTSYGVNEDEMEGVADMPVTRQDTASKPPIQKTYDGSETMIRRRLQETAFFYPAMVTGQNGEVTLNFTMPESVTKWKFMAMAHREDGVSGYIEKYITTSRELMVIPNIPRIVREGDEVVISAKIINTTDTILTGTAWLKVKDAISGKEVTGINQLPVNWKTDRKGNAIASWNIKIPSGIIGIVIGVTAATEEFQDGEEHLVPVLPVKIVLTKTNAVTLSGKGKHRVKMETLLNSKRYDHKSFTLNYTQSAVWEVLGVLPWILERPYENSDNVFNRFFAVTAAKKVISGNPQIKSVLQAWGTELPGNENALLSALEKNPELKRAILNATPWVTEAKSDTERKRRLASLADDGYLEMEGINSLNQLKNLQLADGGWPWFGGMMASEIVTSDIIAGFGYLRKIGVELSQDAGLCQSMGVQWLKNKLARSMETALRNNERKSELEKDTVIMPDRLTVKILYSLSFYNTAEATDAEKFWVEKLRMNYRPTDVSCQSMVALILSRYKFNIEAQKILLSIKEKAIKGENGELFFKSPSGPYWYQLPIERQVIALEAVREINHDKDFIEGLEKWIISQKRTQNWNTTRATISAVYALASSGHGLFEIQSPDNIKVGGKKLQSVKAMAGSGYFSKTWSNQDVKPALGNVEIAKKSPTPSWVAMHWSYNINETDVKGGGFMKLSKIVYKRYIKNGVIEWKVIADTTSLTPGDRLMFNLFIDVPQDLEFVEVSDKRASILEPVNQMSGYSWKSGLGYYISITDAGINFYFDYLPKGKSSLNYEVVVSHKGTASSGPALVQCFYAPEFSGHSKGSVFSTRND